MSGENFAGNIIVNLASLPDFLRSPILRKRVAEYFTLSEPEKREIINNALEAGPSIPFPNFSRLLETWLRALAGSSDDQRDEIFAAYINAISADPRKIITFNLDGILGVFLSLDEDDRERIAASVRRVMGRLDAERRRTMLLVMPGNARMHLGI